MRTHVTFRGFEGIDHLKDFVIRTTKKVIDKYEGSQSLETNLILSAHRQDAGQIATEYECEALIRGAALQAPLVVKERHPDFYLAVQHCMKALAKILRQNAKIEASRRRRAYQDGLQWIHA